MKGALFLWVALCGTVSCVYYNAMWSAEHFASEARRAEARGSALEARTWWARSAEKAESVAVRHPTSRWAEQALVLQGEGLARSGACRRAGAPLALVLRRATAEALRERAALAAAECALEAKDAAAAQQRLAEVTTSRDAQRRSRAALLAGRAAQLVGDHVSAAEWYGRSTDPAADPARARALLEDGRVPEAVALIDTLARRRLREQGWAELLDAAARTAGPETASTTVDRVVAGGRLPVGARARLLLADGDRLLAAGAAEKAAGRYAQVVQLVPDSSDGQRARVRQVRAAAAQADSLPDLVAVREEVARLSRGGAADAAAGEARSLETLLQRAVDPDDMREGTAFRSAEIVRDSLGAVRLAGRLFLAFARERPASLFAPKALVAAATLLPEARDSIVGALAARYPTSPYTLALRGDPSPAFGAAEDSLARALGMGVVAPAALFVSARVAAPVPGPRGPQLDPPLAAGPGLARSPRPGPPGEPRRPGARDRDEAPRRPLPPRAQPRDTS